MADVFEDAIEEGLGKVGIMQDVPQAASGSLVVKSIRSRVK